MEGLNTSTRFKLHATSHLYWDFTFMEMKADDLKYGGKRGK